MDERATEKGKDWRWLAVMEKNPTFDGVFYFGVTSTGIFCRPSCSSRTPKPENVAFFSESAEAERAGFRACLRCRPLEASFSGPQSELLAKALRLLDANRGDIETVDDLSTELGVSPGHLQKTFKTMLGAGPKEVMDM